MVVFKAFGPITDGITMDGIINKKTPLVSGPVAREALAVALEIQNQIWHK